MERIVTFYKKVKKPLCIAFVDGKIYFALKDSKPFTTSGLNQSVLSFKHMKNYFEFLDLMLEIVDDFKLDQYILGKCYDI